MASTVFGEQSPEFRRTEALILEQHPAIIKYKQDAKARWLKMMHNAGWQCIYCNAPDSRRCGCKKE